MTIFEFISDIVQFMVLYPSALLCYIPMKNQLKYSPKKLFAFTVLMLFIFIIVCSIITLFLNIDENIVLLPLIVLLFMLYQSTIKTSVRCSLNVFCNSCALMAFPSNLSYAFDAWRNPLGNAVDFSLEAAFFQFMISCILILLIAYPLYRWGSNLIDSLNFPQIWGAALPFPIIFLLIYLILIPHKYTTLHINNVFPVYLIILWFILFLQFFINIMFYRISMAVISSANDRERIRFFEMQQSQYLSQKRYIEQTEKLRHDFRQSIRAIKGMSDSEDWISLKKYLEEYIKMLPENETTVWCGNSAVNAILNYYNSIAAQNNIRLKWEVKLPEVINIAEPDFCSLLGNILENAIAGCLTEEENRYHFLSLTVINEINLCIVSINSFDGKVNIKNSSYASTKRKGSGLGISSVKMTAERYNGIAQFLHDGHEFSVNVMLRFKNLSE